MKLDDQGRQKRRGQNPRNSRRNMEKATAEQRELISARKTSREHDNTTRDGRRPNKQAHGL